MQTTDLKQIKAAIFDQAFTGKARVMCPMGPVVAVRRRKGQILAMIRGWGKWYPVESVQISLIALVASAFHEVGLLVNAPKPPQFLP